MKRFKLLLAATALVSTFNPNTCLAVSSQTLTAHTNKKSSPRINARRKVTNSWRVTWMPNQFIEPMSSYFFRVDVGCGFLAFTQVTVNMQLTNYTPGNWTTNHNLTQGLRGKVGYNCTPVVEMQIGQKLWKSLGLALSYLHQGGG